MKLGEFMGVFSEIKEDYSPIRYGVELYDSYLDDWLHWKRGEIILEEYYDCELLEITRDETGYYMFHLAC